MTMILNLPNNVWWGWGFGVPAVAMAVAVVFFFSGSRLYRLQKPSGSPLVRLFQVIVASLRKFNDKSFLYETSDPESQIAGSRKLEHTDKLRFFDKAAVGQQMETMHHDPSRRAEIHPSSTPGVAVGIRDHEHHVRPPRQHLGSTHRSQLQDSSCFSFAFRHPQRHLLGSDLRTSHHPHGQKVHPPRTRLHTTPTDGHRPRHLRTLHSGRRSLGGVSAKLRPGERPLPTGNSPHECLTIIKENHVLSQMSSARPYGARSPRFRGKFLFIIFLISSYSLRIRMLMWQMAS